MKKFLSFSLAALMVLAASCTKGPSDVTIKVTVSPDKVQMHEGETVQLSASVLPANASQEVEWSSLNPNVATVDENGLVTAVKVGKTRICAQSTAYPDQLAFCELSVVYPLPTSVWSGSWDFSMGGIPVPLKASLAFEDELVSLIFTSLEVRAAEMPLVLNGHNAYRFESTPDGSGQVSFTLSFQSSSPYFYLSETTFTGTFNPDSDVLDLNATSEDGGNPFGMKTLHFLRETNVTTQTNPFPATKWTASWNNDKTALGIVPFSAILAFEGATVNLVIAADMTVNNVPVVMYGNGPYQFQSLSATDRRGNLSFMVPTSASTLYNIPETTFSGTYNPNSKVMTLRVSSENSNALGTDAIEFVRN